MLARAGFRLGFDHSVVVVMSADPYPDEVFTIFDGQRSVRKFHPYAPEPPHLLELKRRISGIIFKNLEIAPRESLNRFG